MAFHFSLESVLRVRRGQERNARLKLEAMGVRIDQLTAEQARYLSQWEEGT